MTHFVSCGHILTASVVWFVLSAYISWMDHHHVIIMDTIKCLFFLSATLAVAAPLFKTYRVALIFERARNLEEVNITERQLMWYVASAVAVEVVICSVYSFYHLWYGGIEKKYFDDLERIEWKCSQHQTVHSVQFLH